MTTHPQTSTELSATKRKQLYANLSEDDVPLAKIARCETGKQNAVLGLIPDEPSVKVGETSPGRQHFEADHLLLDYYANFVPSSVADEIFAYCEDTLAYFDTKETTQLKVYGKWHAIPRQHVAFGDPGTKYPFSGNTVYPRAWDPVLKRLAGLVGQACDCDFNFVLINRYLDGSKHISEHKDDEGVLFPDAPIAALSFGATRDLAFRHQDLRFKAYKATQREAKARISIPLEHGSLFVMHPPTNQYWYHSLPKRTRVDTVRVSMTFRKMKVNNN